MPVKMKQMLELSDIPLRGVMIQNTPTTTLNSLVINTEIIASAKK